MTTPSTSAAMVAKRHYRLREIYRITERAAATLIATRHLECDKRAMERVMLAVTQINGCAVCSYAHTRFALAMGMPAHEVRALLGGVTDAAPSDELAGIAFGQHYADQRGAPDPAAWQDLVDHHGTRRALCVLRATRSIMWGNATGIPVTSLRSRIAGQPDPGSSLTYEIVTVVGSMLMLPVAVGHALASHWRGRPVTP
ncbi:MAG: carboxymuconolactone decarboxylase family protein [Candidatus Nanopelagicales bacterium]